MRKLFIAFLMTLVVIVGAVAAGIATKTAAPSASKAKKVAPAVTNNVAKRGKMKEPAKTPEDFPYTPEEISNVSNVSIAYDEDEDEFVITWDKPTGSIIDDLLEKEAADDDINYYVYIYPAVDSNQPSQMLTNNIVYSQNEFRVPSCGKIGPHYAGVAVDYNGDNGWITSTLTYSENAASTGKFELPFSMFENFEKTEYIAYDSNGDDVIWEVGQGDAQITWNNDGETAMDDWLVMGPIEIPEGVEGVELSVTAHAENSDYEETFEVWMGKAYIPTDMDIKLFGPQTINSQAGETFTSTKAISEGGLYYVGIHGCSAPDKYTLHITDLKISATNDVDPDPDPEQPVDPDPDDPDNPDANTLPFTLFNGNYQGDFTIFNSNNDADSEWVVEDNKATIRYSSNPDGMDDWLIFGPVAIPENTKLDISMDVSSTSPWGPYEEAIEVKMGDSNTVEAMTKTIMGAQSFNNDDVETLTSTYNVSAGGGYYIGIHAISEYNTGQITVLQFKLTGTNTDEPIDPDPDDPDEPKGELNEDNPFTLPFSIFNGSRDDVKFKIVDSNNDEYTWSVQSDGLQIDYNSDNRSIGKDDWVFVGPVTIPANTDYSVILDLVGSTYEEIIEVKMGDAPNAESMTTELIPATDFTGELVIKQLLKEEDGGNYYIGIHAMSDADMALLVVKNLTLQVPEAFGLPFSLMADDTADRIDYAIFNINDDATWEFNPSDKTLQIGFDSQNFMDDWFIFGPVYLPENTMVDMKLTAWNDPNYPERVEVFMGKSMTVEAMTIPLIGRQTVDIHEGSETYATQYYEENGAYYFIGIHGCSTPDQNHLYVEDFTITEAELPEGIAMHNLALTVGAPESVSTGDEAVVKVVVSNTGLLATGPYKVALSVNGESLENVIEGEAIGYNESVSHDVTIPTTIFHGDKLAIEAEMTVEGEDEDADDNAASLSIRLINKYPGASGLIAKDNGDGTVTLSWRAPNFATADAPVEVVEGAENMVSYSNGMPGSNTPGDFMGDWIVYDGDGLETIPSLNGINLTGYPEDHKVSWVVMDANDLGEEALEKFAPYSGDKCFVSLYAGGSGSDANEDWLVSPVLSGREQTISFWVKELYSVEETFEVWISNTDNAKESFSKLEFEIDGVPATSVSTLGDETWQQYSFTLPEGTMHFAIVYTGNYLYGLLLDDISYQTSPFSGDVPEHTGYNVYYNYQKIASIDDKTVTTYVHDLAGMPLATDATVEHVYHVTAVYGENESKLAQASFVTETVSPQFGTDTDQAFDTRGANTFANLINFSTDVAYGADGDFTVRITPVDGQTWTSSDLTKDASADDWKAAYNAAFIGCKGDLDSQIEMLGGYTTRIDGFYTAITDDDIDVTESESNSDGDYGFDLAFTAPCSGLYTVTVIPTEQGETKISGGSTVITVYPNLYGTFGEGDNANKGFNINGYTFGDDDDNYLINLPEDMTDEQLANSLGYIPGTYFASSLTNSIEPAQQEGGENELSGRLSTKKNANGASMAFCTGMDLSQYKGSSNLFTVTVVKNGASYTYNFEVGYDNDNLEVTTGLEVIAPEANGEVLYFNIQGVPVRNPEHGIYIKIENGKATKVVI